MFQFWGLMLGHKLSHELGHALENGVSAGVYAPILRYTCQFLDDTQYVCYQRIRGSMRNMTGIYTPTLWSICQCWSPYAKCLRMCICNYKYTIDTRSIDGYAMHPREGEKKKNLPRRGS
jgi:hypothetical protein